MRTRMRSLAVASKLPLLRRWTILYRKLLATPGGLPIVKRLVSYVAIVSRDDRRLLKATYHDIDRTTKMTHTTVAERYFRDGARKGRRGLLRILLETRFGKLPDRVLERLATATATEIKRWARAVLTAKTLDKALA